MTFPLIRAIIATSSMYHERVDLPQAKVAVIWLRVVSHHNEQNILEKIKSTYVYIIYSYSTILCIFQIELMHFDKKCSSVVCLFIISSKH